MIPVNDGYWHHFGLTLTSSDGGVIVIVDGSERIQRADWPAQTITGGGTLVIGHMQRSSGFQNDRNLVGKISMMNLWDKVLLGEEIEEMAKHRGNENGNIIPWPQVLVYNIHGDIRFIFPSESNTSSMYHYVKHLYYYVL